MDIVYFDKFFSDEEYKSLLSHIDQIGWKDRGQDYSGSRYTTHYNLQIVNQKEGKKDIETPLVKTALSKLKHTFGEDYYPHNLYFNNYKFGDEIQAHVDRETSTKNNKTLIIYCTKEWQQDWHGETLLYNENKIVGGNLPMPNTAICFNSKILHSMSPISRYCKELRNILVFQLEGR